MVACGGGAQRLALALALQLLALALHTTGAASASASRSLARRSALRARARASEAPGAGDVDSELETDISEGADDGSGNDATNDFLSALEGATAETATRSAPSPKQSGRVMSTDEFLGSLDGSSASAQSSQSDEQSAEKVIGEVAPTPKPQVVEKPVHDPLAAEVPHFSQRIATTPEPKAQAAKPSPPPVSAVEQPAPSPSIDYMSLALLRSANDTTDFLESVFNEDGGAKTYHAHSQTPPVAAEARKLLPEAPPKVDTAEDFLAQLTQPKSSPSPVPAKVDTAEDFIAQLTRPKSSPAPVPIAEPSPPPVPLKVDSADEFLEFLEKEPAKPKPVKKVQPVVKKKVEPPKEESVTDSFLRELEDLTPPSRPHQESTKATVEQHVSEVPETSRSSLDPKPVSTASPAMTGQASGASPDQRFPVWVHGYARSGSSTVLSMLAEAWPGAINASAASTVFALFEPCHKDDELSQELREQGCRGLLQQLSQCDFRGVDNLHGWNKGHSHTRGLLEYKPEAARDACSGAKLVTFKTISNINQTLDWATDAKPLLQSNPALRMIDIIRDPRSIYASMLTTPPFLSTTPRDATVMTDICDNFASKTNINHPRVRKLVFERLIKDPETVMRNTFNFLGASFGDAQRAWINSTLNASGCQHRTNAWEFASAYRDCHTRSFDDQLKWENVLTKAEKVAFASHPSCRRIAEEFDYPITEPSLLDKVSSTLLLSLYSMFR